MTVPPLHQALLLGSSAVTNNSTLWFLPGPTPEGCALCTALYAVGYKMDRIGGIFDKEVYRAVTQYWPWTAGEFRPGTTMSQEISHRHLNGASRESLAAWIATIEPPEAPVEAVEAVEQVEA